MMLFFYFFNFIVVQVQFSAFSPTSPHHPRHLHLPPLIPPHLAFVHVSFLKPTCYFPLSPYFPTLHFISKHLSEMALSATLRSIILKIRRHFREENTEIQGRCIFMFVCEGNCKSSIETQTSQPLVY